MKKQELASIIGEYTNNYKIIGDEKRGRFCADIKLEKYQQKNALEQKIFNATKQNLRHLNLTKTIDNLYVLHLELND